MDRHAVEVRQLMQQPTSFQNGLSDRVSPELFSKGPAGGCKRDYVLPARYAASGHACIGPCQTEARTSTPQGWRGVPVAGWPPLIAALGHNDRDRINLIINATSRRSKRLHHVRKAFDLSPLGQDETKG